MATTPDPSTRKPSIGPRKTSAASPYTAASPHTPLLQRSVSSLFNSPSSTLRGDEDTVVLELGARHMRAGLAGESTPRCVLGFGPEEQRRVGDYRRWLPTPEHHDSGGRPRRRKRRRGEDARWGAAHELWQMDLRDLDLGLVEDKLERAVREALVRYFLTDARPKRFVLALPPLLPRSLLATVLATLFVAFQAPTVSLLSAPVLCTVAAGLRSALVVDMGWAETTVTAVCEYREVGQRKSVRAARLLSEEMGRVLAAERAKRLGTDGEEADEISFEEAEELFVRMGWCMDREQANRVAMGIEEDDTIVTIPLAWPEPEFELELPFSRLAQPAETSLFAQGSANHDLDDDDQPVHLLVYNALRSLSADLRRICMARIVFTGGGACLAGVKRRVLQELEALVSERGWDPVRNYGKAGRGDGRQPTAATNGGGRGSNGGLTNRQPSGDRLTDLRKVTESTLDPPSDDDTAPQPTTPAAFVEQEPDPIVDRIRSRATKHERQLSSSHLASGTFRAVESLGAWAGASIVVGHLRVRGVVEIDRDRFLQHGGLAGGAPREREASSSVATMPTRQPSYGPTAGMKSSAIGGDRTSWTLGIWA